MEHIAYTLIPLSWKNNYLKITLTNLNQCRLFIEHRTAHILFVVPYICLNRNYESLYLFHGYKNISTSDKVLYLVDIGMILYPLFKM